MISSKKVNWNDVRMDLDPETKAVTFYWSCPFCKNEVIGISCDCGSGLRLAARKDYGNNDKYISGRKTF